MWLLLVACGPQVPCPVMSATTTAPDPSLADAKVVEGSDGLLLEIDGKQVPNYDATLIHFEEGDVVSGHVAGSTTTRSSSTSDTRAKGSSPPTSSRSARTSTRRTRSRWARRWMPSSSPRRTRRGV